MKRKFLLGLALLCGVATQAQVLMSEDFSAEQTKSPTDVGYYEFINTQDGDEREVKDGALHFYNSDAVVGQNWQRAIKFRNLPIQENTSYRVKFKLMGSNTYYSVDDDAEVRTNARFALMQGGENLDMGFLASNGEQQLNDISRFQTPDEGKGYFTYTGMFYYTNDAAQKAWYAEQNPTKDELPATYFLTLNVYNPGDFYIDDVVVEQANVGAVTFRDDVIRVDFGYAVDYAALLKGQKRLLMPNDCVKVKLNGEEINVLTVELLSDGSFYIFLDDVYPGGPDDDVEVSFTNPSDPDFELQYAEGRTPGGTVLNFAGEKAVYDENMPDVYSFAFETPTLVSADPENGSFNLPLSLNEFKFTFNKDVDCSLIEARLENQKLTPQPAEGLSKEVTFTRSGGDLAAGQYTLTVTKIYPEVMLAEDVFGEEKLTLSFGAVAVDPNDTVRVVFKDDFADISNNSVPEGWELDSDGTFRTSENGTFGSGCRVINTLTGDIKAGMYICSRSNSGDDPGTAFYGRLEKKLELTNGRHQLTFNAARWDCDNSYCHVQVMTEDGTLLAEDFRAVEPRSNGSTSNAGATKIELQFLAPVAGNYILKFMGRSKDDKPNGYSDAIVIGNIEIKYLPAAAGVDEMNQLNTALDEAKAALAAGATDRYIGPDYEYLQQIIAKHDGKATVYTAPSMFFAAVKELNEATNAMKTHINLCDTYDPLVDQAKSARDTRTDTKYQNHECYAAIEAAIAKYEGRVLTDNDELREAITELQNTTNLVKNIGRVVDNYIASMVSGIATLNKLGAENEELTNEVNNLLTDDPVVKKKVQNAITGALYSKLSDPNNDVFAEKLDDVTLEQYVDSFDVSVFINNPELYYTGWDDKCPQGITKVQPSSETLPGWTISNAQKGWSFEYHYPWGASSQYYYNEYTCPNANGMIAAWTSGFDIEQTITNLPAGKYTLYVGIGERGGNESPTSYIFANDLQQVIPVIAGSVEPTDNCIIENIEVTDGQLSVGAHVDNTDHIFLNCFHLILKAAADGFDYGKAYTEGIDDISNSMAVRRTELFDLNGRRVTDATRGVVIVKKTMTDGRIATEKVVK